MNCEQARPLIDAYADGELDAARSLELENHLRDCAACALAWRNLRSVKKAMKQESLFFTAPPALKRRVMAELRSQTGNQQRWRFWNWNWLAAATSFAAVGCVAVVLAITLARPSEEQQIAREIVSSHVRSLMASHALDVASSDQHTVKPWFDGKLDFAPPVKDLAAQEFPLAGGRLDYVQGRPVAALVFQRHKHVINLFIWPAKESASAPTVFGSIQGYNLIHWLKAGMSFWAVSDLNEKELMEFAQDFAS
jgi:anti-sigma factor RsiW